MQNTNSKIKAILLIGPTGSGKSPIGNFLEQMTGYTHLDFGQILRNIELGQETQNLKPKEVEYIKNLLETNSLFPPDKTNLALKIIKNHLDRRNTIGIIFNGFPRSVYQTNEILKSYNLYSIIHLICDQKTSLERVINRRSGIGLDHSNRKDDHEKAILNKIRIFEKETKPLINFFNEKNIKILNIDIKTDENEEFLAKKIIKYAMVSK